MTGAHTQNPQKADVQAGLAGNIIMGPIFIYRNLTGELYHEVLVNEIISAFKKFILVFFLMRHGFNKGN